jgi:hypothetical protein
MPKWVQVGDQRFNLDAIWALKWGADFLAVFVPGSATPRRFEGQVAQKIWDYAQGEVWETPEKPRRTSRGGRR